MGKLAPYHGTYASARSASELLDLDTINAGCDEVDEKAGRLTEQANTIQTATANLDEKNFSVSQSTPQQKISETCSNINEVKIFENDVYKKPISIFTDKYYLVADYNSEYTFNKMHLVNIINGEKITIRSYDDISFDSYIMGEVEGKIYLFDIENNKQYEIDIEEKMINNIGNKNDIKYYNGKWTKLSLNEAKSGKRFSTNKEIEGYEKVDKINNYYYFYKKENKKYKAYRADLKNEKLKTYLFDTTDINSVTYIKDNIYYKNQDTYNMYSKEGSRKLITDREIEFNSDISFGIYEK